MVDDARSREEALVDEVWNMMRRANAVSEESDGLARNVDALLADASARYGLL